MKSNLYLLSILKSNVCKVIGLVVILLVVSCQSGPEKENESYQNTVDTLATNSTANPAEEKYEAAKKTYTENPDDPDALIWYGRRTAYLGNYEEAIDIYTIGIEKHPEDARMYRHRGHRYISTRQYNQAVEDFEKAATLIDGQEDQIEPDGLPNDRNIPLSTLHGNIWYHLGLAYYLKNDMENALRAYSNRTVTERYDDNMVSGGYWLYMINRRLGNDEAANAAISEVTKDMDIIENTSYYNMCLFFKGLMEEDDLKPEGKRSSSDDVYGYALGNWYLYNNQDTAAAKDYFMYLLENGNKYSFAYLAAESDWNRIYEKE
ncbi:MAG: tetratricopeptide repeat protein [Bacteroidota bacterium]